MNESCFPKGHVRETRSQTTSGEAQNCFTTAHEISFTSIKISWSNDTCNGLVEYSCSQKHFIHAFHAWDIPATSKRFVELTLRRKSSGHVSHRRDVPAVEIGSRWAGFTFCSTTYTYGYKRGKYTTSSSNNMLFSTSSTVHPIKALGDSRSRSCVCGDSYSLKVIDWKFGNSCTP